MVPVWLYLADGTAFDCVYVYSPLPVSILWQQRRFCWNGAKYVETAVPESIATALPDEAVRSVEISLRPTP